MKKYVKPELIFESFEMTQQVAACTFDLVSNTSVDHNDETCAFKGIEPNLGIEITIFMNGTTSGDVSTDNPKTAEGYCYFGSTDSGVANFNIFNS